MKKRGWELIRKATTVDPEKNHLILKEASEIQSLITKIKDCLTSRYPHGTVKGNKLLIKNERILIYRVFIEIYFFLQKRALFIEFWKDEPWIKVSIKRLYRSDIGKSELKKHSEIKKSFSRSELNREKRKMIRNLFQILDHEVEHPRKMQRTYEHFIAKLLIATKIKTGSLIRVEQYLHSEFSNPN